MQDGPAERIAERPVLKALITRCEDHRRAFAVIDLLGWPYYESRGWTFVALDPDTEAAWNAWRGQNPEAA